MAQDAAASVTSVAINDATIIGNIAALPNLFISSRLP